MITTLRRWLRAFAAPAMVLFVAACGGGDGGGGGNQAVAPSIVTHPAAAMATEGETATFVVVADGTAPLAYQWQRNGTDIAGATAASYTTPAVAVADDGAQYSVVVSNAAGSVTSSTALLTAQAALPPTIVAQPSAVSVVAPATATFSVAAQGSSLAYQWTRSGAPIAGATSASYTTPATAVADSGALYAVVISNTRGEVASDDAELTVTAAPTPPAIATQPTDATVASGETASFSVVATGTAPLAYQWQRNGAAIAGANAASYTTPATVDGDDGALYSVVIDNVTATPVTSAAVKLSVIPEITPPAIAAQPQAQSVTVGQTATFTVAVTGTPPLDYQWRRNGTAIAGADGASYTTQATVIGDNGAVFSVVVSNASKKTATSADALLSVTEEPQAPSIIAQPSDATVSIGASVTFTVGATGTAPLAYQWRRNGAPIAGANAASYTIASATLADHDALFDVVVSNAAATTATSNAARLTVLDAWVGIREDGAIGRNNGDARDIGRSVASDANGNVVIAGHTNGLFAAPGGEVTTKVFIAKYSGSGVRTWVRDVIEYGANTGGEDHASVAVDRDRNIYVAGETRSTWPAQTQIGRDDAYVAKYDPDGNLLWARQFGSTDHDEVGGLAVDANGNAFVVGHSNGQLPEQSEVHRGQDFFIAKFDTNGNRQWIRQSGGPGYADLGQAVAVDGAGNAYMTGRVDGEYPGSPRRNLRYDAYVIKYDPAGNRVWFSRIAGEHHDAGHGIAVSADGGTIYVGGATNSNFDVAGYPQMDIFCCTHDDAFIAKLDGSGAIVWAHNLPPGPADGKQTLFNDEARGVATDAAGSVAFVTGHTLGVMPTQTTKGARDIWVARFAGDGTRDWVRQFGGGAPTQATTINDSGLGIAIDRNGDVLVTGEVMGSFGTPNPDTRLNDWFVMKLRAADGSAY